MSRKKIVCLGGGIGTVNLIKGLKEYTDGITVVVSMGDDGGSAGRLRRFYRVPPPGDIVSCIAALSSQDPLMRDLLIYRFSGNRYGSDYSLAGHKFGNLMLVALASITGDFNEAVFKMQKIFHVKGKILPSTTESISLSARTSVGEIVDREENIDLGRFTGKIEELTVSPPNPSVSSEVKEEIAKADVIIGGPGDLYTTILPVLVVPSILEEIKKSKAKKIFVVNVANKIFETPNYKISDFISAIAKHCGAAIFDTVLVNSNTSSKIPAKFSGEYDFVSPQNGVSDIKIKVIKRDLLDDDFPLYHSSKKLAKAVIENI